MMEKQQFKKLVDYYKQHMLITTQVNNTNNHIGDFYIQNGRLQSEKKTCQNHPISAGTVFLRQNVVVNRSQYQL